MDNMAGPCRSRRLVHIDSCRVCQCDLRGHFDELVLGCADKMLHNSSYMGVTVPTLRAPCNSVITHRGLFATRRPLMQCPVRFDPLTAVRFSARVPELESVCR